MMEQSVSLIPFPAPRLPEITVTAKISLQRDLLDLQYYLGGGVEDIFLPSVSSRPARKNDLWKSTCFEFFLAVKDQPQYWEFNISPSGDWNVYHMDAYRRVGFREEILVAHLPVEIQSQAGLFLLHISMDLSSILPRRQPLEMGITAVIQTRDGNKTYWALTHPGPYADFHLRQTFTVKLPSESLFSEHSTPEQLTKI